MGMESSQNSLLSTILMTLPLIVVPAIALLRPPGSAESISTSPLSASEELLGEEFWIVNEDEFSGSPAAPEAARSGSSADPFLPQSDSPEQVDASADALQPVDGPPATVSPLPDTLFDETRILEKQLLASGAEKIFWFTASAEHPFGVAVFFPTAEESVRLRFDAVAASRREALADVVGQVEQWRRESDNAGGPETSRR